MRKAVDKFVVKTMIRKNQLKQLCARKHKGVDGVIVALILVVVAVGVAILFRNQTMTMVSNFLTSVNTKVTSMLSGTADAIS